VKCPKATIRAACGFNNRRERKVRNPVKLGKMNVTKSVARPTSREPSSTSISQPFRDAGDVDDVVDDDDDDDVETQLKNSVIVGVRRL